MIGIAFIAVVAAQPLLFFHPTVFSPGVISGAAHDSAPAFTPDGRTVYFGRSTATASFILVSRRQGKEWSKPEIASFSGRWLDMEPAMAPDGSYLIFASNRPATPGGRPVDGVTGGKKQPGEGANLWRVVRQGEGWSEPVRLPDTINASGSTYSPSIAGNGTLFFMQPNDRTHKFQLFDAKLAGERYDAPRPLPFSDGSDTDVDPAIARDQSFIVFGSGRHAHKDIDLFIAFKTGQAWGAPIYLGDSINGPSSDAEPRLSPDNKTLYFASDRIAPAPHPLSDRTAAAVLDAMSTWNNGLYNIWTVDLQAVIESLRTRPAASEHPRAATAPPRSRTTATSSRG